MKHITLILAFLLIQISTDAQKRVVIPDNHIVVDFFKSLPNDLRKYGLDDLRVTSDSIAIRIWRNNEIVTLRSADSIKCEFKIRTYQDDPIISKIKFSSLTSRSLLDSLVNHNIMILQDEIFVRIDGTIVIFEISTPDQYRIISIGSPDAERSENSRSTVDILRIVNELLELNPLRKDFLESLDPGFHRWGMTIIHVDKFLTKNITKTDLYSLIENRVKKELLITDSTSHLDFPIVLINDKNSKFADINKYTLKDVKKIDILSADSETAIYGTIASHGVIKISLR